MHGFVSTEKISLSSEHLTKSDLWEHSSLCSKGDLCGFGSNCKESSGETSALARLVWEWVRASGVRSIYLGLIFCSAEAWDWGEKGA